MYNSPVDNFGTVVGESPTPYGILALWAVNGLQGFQPNSGIEFHDFSMIFPEIFPFFQDTSTE